MEKIKIKNLLPSQEKKREEKGRAELYSKSKTNNGWVMCHDCRHLAHEVAQGWRTIVSRTRAIFVSVKLLIYFCY